VGGRGNATFPEPTSGHANCQKTRTPRSGSPTRRVDAVLGSPLRYALLATIFSRTNWRGPQKMRMTIVISKTMMEYVIELAKES
jgi:hypothetical protein